MRKRRPGRESSQCGTVEFGGSVGEAAGGADRGTGTDGSDDLVAPARACAGGGIQRERGTPVVSAAGDVQVLVAAAMVHAVDPQLEEALTEHREQLEKSGQDCWAARQS
jgi:hypothetical protein